MNAMTLPDRTPPDGTVSTSVHIYATMRLRVDLGQILPDHEAIPAALAKTDLARDLVRGDYAEAITAFMVDQVSADGDYLSEHVYDEEQFRDHSGIEQGRVITLSTAHIQKSDVTLLVRIENTKHLVMVAPYPEGWVVSLRPRDTAEQIEKALADLSAWGFSPAFLLLWKGLRDRNFSLLMLDQDGSEHPEFPLQTW